jgi:hypothetical protein
MRVCAVVLIYCCFGTAQRCKSFEACASLKCCVASVEACSFHSALIQRASQADGQDIDDPLYGNFGAQQEQACCLCAVV